MSVTHREMTAYYAQRASEYKRIYYRSERQDDLRKVKALVESAFPRLRVLEVACGTGYWTQYIAMSAAAILATDCNEEVIQLAKQKDYGKCPVSFQIADTYTLSQVPPNHEAAFAGFWWSHMPKSRIGDFITTLHSKLQGSGPVLLIDNSYVEGSSTPISRTDVDGNTYQLRKLQDGSEHEVLKNFPTEQGLAEVLDPFAASLEFFQFKYYWALRYKLR